MDKEIASINEAMPAAVSIIQTIRAKQKTKPNILISSPFLCFVH
jgi:hypothetical protein